MSSSGKAGTVAQLLEKSFFFYITNLQLLHPSYAAMSDIASSTPAVYDLSLAKILWKFVVPIGLETMFAEHEQKAAFLVFLAEAVFPLVPRVCKLLTSLEFTSTY